MGDKKQILIFSVFYFPFVGGAEVALKEVITRLTGKYDFTIITGKLNSETKREEVMDGINVIRVGWGIKWLDKLFFPFFCLFKALSLEKPNILYLLLENQAAIAGNLYNWFRKVSTIYNLQSGDTEKYIRDKLGSFYFLYNWTYQKKYFYCVLSKYLRKRAIEHGVPAKQITIIPNGVNTSHFNARKVSKTKRQQLIKKHKLQGKKIIFTASRLAHKNALGDVIKAMPDILKKTPNAMFVIAGTGELEAELKQLTKDFAVEKQIIFLGFINHKDLPAYLTISDVFIRPSLSEGFGNSYVEALSCGVPIIGTPVGGIPDFLEHEKTGLMCKVRDPHDIAKQATRLLTNKKLSQAIVKTGQKMVKELYEWDNIAKQYDKVFTKL